MKPIYFFLLILLFTACQKQPTANFNFDKSTYTAGDIIHLTDASTNAHSWKWTMPDGKIYTTQNVDFVIDTNDIGGSETVTLEVFSRNGKKVSTVSKTINVSQTILASDYITALEGNFMLSEKKSIVINNFWEGSIGHHYSYSFGYVNVYFPSRPNASQLYSLKSNYTSLSQSEACINYHGYDGLEYSTNEYSKYGQLNVVIDNSGRIKIDFNNIKVVNLSDSTKHNYLTGNITFY
ncbi:MAG: hypothetical protein RI955_448 [Bacteroidota bacterium]|jgi:hypothetical protein